MKKYIAGSQQLQAYIQADGGYKDYGRIAPQAEFAEVYYRNIRLIASGDWQ